MGLDNNEALDSGNDDLMQEKVKELQLPYTDNALLDLYVEYIAILLAIPRQIRPADLAFYRQELINKIMLIRRKGVLLDYHPSVLDKACFIVCAATDEAIIYSNWGKSAGWENATLLNHFFNQNNGGEVFFDLLEKAKYQPKKLLDFIELQFVLLKIGFMGKYRFESQYLLNEYASELYECIFNYKNYHSLKLSDHTKKLKPKSQIKFIAYSLWISLTLLVVLAVGATSYIFYEKWVESVSQQFVHLQSVENSEDLYLHFSDDEFIDENITYKPPKTGWYVQLPEPMERGKAKNLMKHLILAGFDVQLQVKGNEALVNLFAGKIYQQGEHLNDLLHLRYSQSGRVRYYKKESFIHAK
ncbi:type IVB secretion system protein IcmH/DotU [uncultured Shewanella sp.]|uniref:type IVB secretion system protein IcmH/DotU n=1 Tax=uncultured Shewanella sp. TaxID=173975 RepID=UPI002612E947|nr:type IVB secretion system protein IcmH/DotU [uncultured Shewanella sp.]